MKKTNLKRTTVFAALIMLVIVVLTAFTGCNAGVRIDAPERLEAELGLYVVPDYNVVDANGMILAGYKVSLKSVTKENGEAVDFMPTAVTIEEKGVYKFVYTAEGGRVKDATVLIDFADRTAPKANVNTSTLPAFFITGNSYRIPSYTLSGDYDREKCFVKVFHIADDNTETEVETKSNRFVVTEQSGAYEIRIHVEDAAGNFKDYKYRKAVDAPEQVKENYILYLDEEFGARQVYCMESSYTGEFVSKDTDGAKVHGDDNGSYKVTFNGATANNEGYVVFKTPAILDVNEFFEIYMWVYNDSDQDIIVGATWWNDTVAKAGEWTKVSFSVDNWGGNNVCTWAENSSKLVGTNDISNVGFRFIFDYDHEIIPNGTFYLSPLIGVPNVDSNVVAGENVILDKASYHVGSVVNLSAEEIDGKVVDSFFVDGKAILGDTFVVTGTEHNVTVKYVDALTLDNMTWATEFSYVTANPHWMNANFITPTYIGNDENWIMSANIAGGYNENTGGQTMNLSLMIGDIESVELQLNKTGGVFKWYFDGKNYNTPIANLSTANFEKLKNASEENPVNIQVMRKGSLLIFMIDGEYAASCAITESLSSNAFGLGYRKEGADRPDTVILADAKAVVGEERTNLFYASLVSTIKCENQDVTTDKAAYHLGDTVTLTAKEKTDGTVFGYFTLDGQKLTGSTFTVTAKTHTVGVVYVGTTTITFGEGVSAAEGNSVGRGTNLTLSHGEAPQAGKVFDYYLVDDEIKVYGNVFTVTAQSHNITAVWTDADKITWGDADAKYNYDTIMGSESTQWETRGLDGYVFGSAEYWAVSVDIKHTTEWNSFEFIQGSKQSIRIRFHQGNYFGILLMDNGTETCPADHNEFVVAYPHQNAEMVAKLLAGTTITCVRYGDKITMYAGNVPFFTTDYAVDHTGNWFGLGFVADSTAATKPNMTNIKFICGKDKVDSYLDNNWQDIQITVDENTILDKASYKQYETVVLTAKDAPQGKKFLHFVVNGSILDGTSFVATELTYRVQAVYDDISNIKLGNGITTADGETQYAIGATVTLTYGGDIPDGKFFNCFTVDGERINGNAFVASKPTHTVAVEFASTADEMAWTTAKFVAPEGGDIQKTKLGEGTQWVLTYDVYGFVFGDNFSIANNQYIGAYVGNVQNGADLLVGFELAMWGKKLDIYGGNYMYVPRNLVETELSLLANATQESPLTIIYVRDENVVKTFIKKGTDIYLISETDLVKQGVKTNGFGYGARKDFNSPTVTDIKFVTGEGKTQAYLNSLTVTVNKTKVTTDKTSYLLGETVTLTADAAASGMKFSHFTVDGVEIKGDSFVATKNSYEVEAVYGEISALTLNDGVTTTDGETAYARNAVVTLKYDGPHAEGKILDYFTVDGNRIVGSTFKATKANHIISAVFADSADKLTWVTSAEAETTDVTYSWGSYSFAGVAVGEGDCWAIRAQIGKLTDFEDGKDKWYGFDFLVGMNASIHIRIHTTNGVSVFAMGTEYEDGTSLGTVMNGNAVIAACKQSTDESPVTFTVMRNGNVYYVLFNNELILKAEHEFKTVDNKLGLGNTKPSWLPIYTVTSYTYRTGADIVEYLTTVKVNGTKATTDKADGVYAMGDTVTLTADVAATGMKFSHFTVDGVRIEGSTFIATKSTHTVEAVYGEISMLTLNNGVTTSDGEMEYARNAIVTLKYDGPHPEGKILDYFTLDGNRIVGSTFKATKAKHVISAVFADSADKLTWVTDAEAETSDVTYSWRSYSFAGTSVAVSDKWAMEATVNEFADFNDKWYALDFLVGNGVSLQIRLHSTGLVQIKKMGTDFGDGADLGTVQNAASIIVDCKAATAENPAKFTVMRNADTYYILFNGQLILKANATFTTDNAFGFGATNCGTWLNNRSADSYKYRTGTEIVEHLTAVKVNGTKVTTDNADGVYTLGDTVTLTADVAASGMKFSHFIVDGVKIEGSTFIATKSTHTVEAVYGEISTLALNNGVTTSDGETEYSRNAIVTLEFGGDIPDGQFLNYFTVDGERINGNTFVASKPKHTVAVEFASTVDEMVWTTAEFVAPEGGDAQKTKLGEGTQWVLSYDVYGFEFGDNFLAPHNQYVGAYVGNVQNGGDQLVGFEFSKDWGNKFDAYGGTWKSATRTITENELMSLFANATQESPLTIVYIRSENIVKTLLKKGTDVYLVSVTDLTTLEVQTNGFGYGARAGLKSPTVTNIKYVTGEGKTQAYLNSLTVTVNKTKVTTDKTSYVLGDTVTLTADAAEEGFKFSHFTVDGVEIKGNSFVATKNSYDVEAVYGEITMLTLNNGVTTANGETEYARNAIVTLKYDGDIPDGEFFNCFTVDGEKIVGNTFVASKPTHTVAVEFASTVDEMVWTTAEFVAPEGGDAQKTKLGEGTQWVLSYDVYGFVFGDNFSIANNQYIGAYVGNVEDGGDQLVGFELATWGKKFDAYGGNWKSATRNLTENELLSLFANATQESPLTIVYVRNGNKVETLLKKGTDMYLVSVTDLTTLEVQTNGFGYGARVGFNSPTVTNIKFVMGEGKTLAYSNSLTVTLNKTNVTTDKDNYLLGETVTLTADTAEEGFKFSHFTVDGVAITGNTFVASKSTHQVVAVYEDERQLVLSDKPANGTIVKITNDEYVLPTSKVTDASGTELTDIEVTVEVTDAAGNVYTVTDGKITLEYKGVIDVTVTYTCAELNKQESFTVTLQRSDSNVIMQASETGAKVVDPNRNKVSYDPSVQHGDDIGSVKVYDIIDTDTGVFLSTWDLTDYKFVEFYAYTEADGVKMGGWWCNDTLLVKNQWTKVIIDKTSANYDYHSNKIVLRLMGSCKDQTVWISSVKAYGVNDFTQVNDISNAHVTQTGSSCEWTTEKIYAGEDANVVDKGSLKVTATQGENYIISDTNYIKNLSDYNEVYFYVYTETATSTEAGGWWCGDTPLQAGQWTKVTFTEAENPQNVDDKGIFTNGVYSFVFRLKDATAGEVFYITSLYCVPKA